MGSSNRFLRSKDRKIAGVCGGIAQYFGWDPSLVRIGYILLSFFTAFSGAIVYLIIWLVAPEEQ